MATASPTSGDNAHAQQAGGATCCQCSAPECDPALTQAFEALYARAVSENVWADVEPR